MVTEDETAIEDRMQLVHSCLKDINTPASGALPTELQVLVERAAMAILAPRRRIRPDADDDLTRLLNELVNRREWRVLPFSAPRPARSLSTFYRSGADLETTDGSRFDVWAFLVNARIGLIAPRVNA